MIKFNSKTCKKIYKGGDIVNNITDYVSGNTQTIIKSPEYLSRTAPSSGYIGLGEYFTSDCTIEIDFQMTNAEGYAVIGDIFGTSNNDWRFFLGAYKTQNQIVMYDFKGSRITKNITSNYSRYHWEIGNYYIKDLDTNTNVVTGTAKSNFTRPNQMYLFHIEGNLGSQQNTDYGNVYFIKIKKGGVLVKDFIPYTDMQGNYGLYDKVSNTVFTSTGQMTGSSTINDVVVGSATTSESKVVFQYITSGDAPTPPSPIDYANEYLSFVAETDNVTFSLYGGTAGNTFQYSTDSGTTWNNVAIGQTTSAINTGDKMMFKASGLTINNELGIGTIRPSSSASVEGNIMSLCYGDNFSGQTTIPANFQFRKLFSGATNITNAENMIVTASSFPKQCYSQMFHSCSNLVKAPKTIGTSASTFSGDYCFSDMFANCTSMTVAPELPMTSLGKQCYWYMMQVCTSLTQAPLLPAPTINTQSYCGLFMNSTNLNSVTCLATGGISTSNCNEWLKNVASSGTFTKAAGYEGWSRGQNGVPNNWTIVDYSE